MECQYCEGVGARLKSTNLEETAKIANARRGHVDFHKGDLIESELQSSQFIYIVAEGLAHVFKQLPDGRRQIMRYLYPGDLATLISPQSRDMQSGIRCLTDVRACRFDAGVLRDAVYTKSDLLSRLTRHCMDEVAEQGERLVDIGARTSEEALANFLLAHFWRVRGQGVLEGEVPFPMRLNDIADTVGVTEVHAGRLFRRLQELGAIERRASSQLYVRAEVLASFLRSNGET